MLLANQNLLFAILSIDDCLSRQYGIEENLGCKILHGSYSSPCSKIPETSDKTWKDKIIQQVRIQNLGIPPWQSVLEGKKGRGRYLFKSCLRFDRMSKDMEKGRSPERGCLVAGFARGMIDMNQYQGVYVKLPRCAFIPCPVLARCNPQLFAVPAMMAGIKINFSNLQDDRND